MHTTDEHDGVPLEKVEDAQRAGAREEQFRTLAENIPGVATFLDRIVDDPGHSIPVYISPQIEQMLGYPLSEWLDESELWLRILHLEDRDRLVAADENARKHKLTLSEEYRLLHRDGHVVWVSERAAVVPDVSTGTLYWQGVMVDITKRKRAEQAMADSELKFRTLFDAAAIGVFTLALDGRITEANPTIEWLGRYEEGELSGIPLADLVDPDDEEILDELAELRTVAGRSIVSAARTHPSCGAAPWSLWSADRTSCRSTPWGCSRTSAPGSWSRTSCCIGPSTMS